MNFNLNIFKYIIFDIRQNRDKIKANKQLFRINMDIFIIFKAEFKICINKEKMKLMIHQRPGHHYG